MNEFKQIVSLVAYAIEGLGVAVIVAGCLAATVRIVPQLRSLPLHDIYQNCRRLIGRSILLGLEFLIAGDVIRTVIVSHAMEDVAVLALMVLIRAFLSFTLTLEIEGRLPWRGAERGKP